MSDQIGEVETATGDWIDVGVFCGPVGPGVPGERRRVQLSIGLKDGVELLVLTEGEAAALGRYLLEGADRIGSRS